MFRRVYEQLKDGYWPEWGLPLAVSKDGKMRRKRCVSHTHSVTGTITCLLHLRPTFLFARIKPMAVA